MSGPGFLMPGGGTTYHENGEAVGEVRAYVEFALEGTPTVHQIAKRVGGSIRHALPVWNDGAALCGAKPTGGFGSRGTWRCFARGSVYGVTCPKCQTLEPVPAADLPLDAVLARCLDSE